MRYSILWRHEDRPQLILTVTDADALKAKLEVILKYPKPIATLVVEQLD